MTELIRETLVTTKRRIREGQWWEITAEASWADMGGGTIRGQVTHTSGQRFHFRHPLGTETIRWPSKSEVTVHDDGVIRLGGSKPMTLVRVDGPVDGAWRLIEEIARIEPDTDGAILQSHAMGWITRARNLRGMQLRRVSSLSSLPGRATPGSMAEPGSEGDAITGYRSFVGIADSGHGNLAEDHEQIVRDGSDG